MGKDLVQHPRSARQKPHRALPAHRRRSFSLLPARTGVPRRTGDRADASGGFPHETFARPAPDFRRTQPMASAASRNLQITRGTEAESASRPSLAPFRSAGGTGKTHRTLPFAGHADLPARLEHLSLPIHSAAAAGSRKTVPGKHGRENLSNCGVRRLPR